MILECKVAKQFKNLNGPFFYITHEQEVNDIYNCMCIYMTLHQVRSITNLENVETKHLCVMQKTKKDVCKLCSRLTEYGTAQPPVLFDKNIMEC